MSKKENGSLYHIAVAVQSISEVEKIYQKLIGLEVVHREKIKDQGVKTSMLKSKSGKGTAIELIEPIDENSPISNFLKKRGEGIHHICFYVDNIESTLLNLKKEGIRLIDEKPRIGAYNSKVAFIDPKSFNGVLIELAELQEEENN